MNGFVRVICGMVLCLLATGSAWAQTFFKVPAAGHPILSVQSTGYSGAAWIDMNGNGKLDLFINNGFLYRGTGTGAFGNFATNIGSGIAVAGGNGVTWGDYDNDGDLDCFIASSSSALYNNNGSGGFTQITTGDIGQILDNRGWSPAFGDYNGDGNLDLAITHPAGFVPGGSTTNHLLLNDGPPGYGFTRITTGPIVTGLSSYTVGTWSDFDADGDLDYSIGAGPANGTQQPDFLYLNQLTETGTADFVRSTQAPIATEPQDGQVWNWIDYDNDGDLDAHVTNWAGGVGGLENRLYRNDGGSFVKITSGAIVTDSELSLSSVWGDFDNDGDLDCFIANDSNQPDRYYSNNGDGSFTSLTNAVTESVTHRGATAGDYDNDGDLDLYVDGPGAGGRSLFRNDTANGNHWLKIPLTGVDSNGSGIGAKVRATAVIGGVTVQQMREVSAQNTFLGHNSLIVHFGLGDATVVDSLSIEWPSGNVQTLTGVAVDQRLEITEETTTPAVPDGYVIPGSRLRADRIGSDIEVTYDAAACPPVNVNVYLGSIGDFSSFTGAGCSFAASGSATLAIPDNSWFLVAATNGIETDGSYGVDSSGAERVIAGAASSCPAITQHAVNDSCP